MSTRTQSAGGGKSKRTGLGTKLKFCYQFKIEGYNYKIFYASLELTNKKTDTQKMQNKSKQITIKNRERNRGTKQLKDKQKNNKMAM